MPAGELGRRAAKRPSSALQNCNRLPSLSKFNFQIQLGTLQQLVCDRHDIQATNAGKRGSDSFLRFLLPSLSQKNRATPRATRGVREIRYASVPLIHDRKRKAKAKAGAGARAASGGGEGRVDGRQGKSWEIMARVLSHESIPTPLAHVTDVGGRAGERKGPIHSWGGGGKDDSL